MISSAEEFIKLRLSDEPADYYRAAHEEAALTTWLELIRDHEGMRFWVAQNKSVPVTILEHLSGDQDWRVRAMVASKGKLPEHLQLKLARDGQASVRSQLAHNTKATLQALRVLALDEDQEIRVTAEERLSKMA